MFTEAVEALSVGLIIGTLDEGDADVELDAHACPDSHGRQSASDAPPSEVRCRPGGQPIGALNPRKQ